MKYVAPNKGLKSFTCPHCHTLSLMHKEHWENNGDRNIRGVDPDKIITVCICVNCGRKTVWVGDTYIYPDQMPVEPNNDMPEDVRSLYYEAGSIYTKSPRAACALLRLAIDKLCSILGADQSTIDEKIGYLVRQGLSVGVQKALDIVRVVGNKAVHPGYIAVDLDDVSTAEKLFELINMIIDRMISEPRKLDELYESLPASTKEAIIKRDKPHES